jgi:hypothetical protein
MVKSFLSKRMSSKSISSLLLLCVIMPYVS